MLRFYFKWFVVTDSVAEYLWWFAVIDRDAMDFSRWRVGEGGESRRVVFLLTLRDLLFDVQSHIGVEQRKKLCNSLRGKFYMMKKAKGALGCGENLTLPEAAILLNPASQCCGRPTAVRTHGLR